MKTKVPMIALIVALLGMVFTVYYTRQKREKRQLSIEAAKEEFAQHAPFDSAFARNDTVSFYLKGKLVGKSILVE